MKWYIKKKYISMSVAKKCVSDNILANVLATRKFKSEMEIKNYLYGDITNLYDTSIDDLSEVAKVLCNRKSLVVGIASDYDVDGIMSGYLLCRLMEELEIPYHLYVPDRIQDGYGVSKNSIDKAIAHNCNLLITCDAGISAFESIDYAKEQGLFTIITDHHNLPTDKNNKITLPNADLIVNPKIGKYPFKNLCGAGVVYKLILAVYKEKGWDLEKANKYLPYTAFATICDVVELLDENRIIVKYGLPMINETDNVGLNALIAAAELDQKKSISVYDIGFILGPMINASSRMESADIAMELMLTNDREKAKELAEYLRKLNKDRQELTNISFEKLKKQVEEKYMNDQVLVLYDDTVLESIAGIIAGKIKEEFYKPTIVLTNSSKEKIAKGSGRSIESYDIFYALSTVQDVLTSYGGHPMAAGLSLPISKIDTLRRLLNHQCELSDDELIPKLKLDTVLQLKDISLNLAEMLNILEPFGTSNPKPLFGSKSLCMTKIEPLGKSGQHYKLYCKDDTSINQFILFFRADELMEKLKEKYNELTINNLFNGKSTVPIDLVYSISVNEFRGHKSPQTIIEDYRI